MISLLQAFPSLAATLLHHHVVLMPHDHLSIFEVQHGDWCQVCGHTRQTGCLVWMMIIQQALESGEEENNRLENIYSCCWGIISTVAYDEVFQSYLYVCVVSRGEGLIYWCGTGPFAAISVVSFGIDNPLTPAEFLKVHPHVHLPAQMILFLLLCCLVTGSISPTLLSLLLGLLVPLFSAAPHPGGYVLPAQTSVFGVLCCADERWYSLVLCFML